VEMEDRPEPPEQAGAVGMRLSWECVLRHVRCPSKPDGLYCRE
jgi:hypothetical protein